MTNSYIALIHAEEICAREKWPLGLAVYYDPGSVSTGTYETLSYCFLHRLSGDEVVVWSRDDCRLGRQSADKAIRLLDQRRRQVDANLPDDWPHGIRPTMQRWAKILFRLHYFEPNHRYVTKMLQLVGTGNVLSEKQVACVQEIYRERGNVAGLRKRQLIQWRLMRLAEIDLKPRDQKTVKDFARYAKRKSGLRKTRKPVIGALEGKYWRPRLEATKHRAGLIAASLSG
ncbi:MAG: hypothetical protein U9R15_14350 [Chloroflexota bacterium]|nr:hypothetical protein [Chloroflexota bacterium]